MFGLPAFDWILIACIVLFSIPFIREALNRRKPATSEGIAARGRRLREAGFLFLFCVIAVMVWLGVNVATVIGLLAVLVLGYVSSQISSFAERMDHHAVEIRRQTAEISVLLEEVHEDTEVIRTLAAAHAEIPQTSPNTTPPVHYKTDGSGKVILP